MEHANSLSKEGVHTQIAMSVGVVRPQRKGGSEGVLCGRQVSDGVLRASQQLARPEVARLQPRRLPAKTGNTGVITMYGKVPK